MQSVVNVSVEQYNSPTRAKTWSVKNVGRGGTAVQLVKWIKIKVNVRVRIRARVTSNPFYKALVAVKRP